MSSTSSANNCNPLIKDSSIITSMISNLLITTCSIVSISLFIYYKKRKTNKLTNDSKEKQTNPTEIVIDNIIKNYQVGQPHPYTLETMYNGCIYLDYNCFLNI